MSKKNKKETAEVAEAKIPEVQELTSEQEIAALRHAHQFFGSYQNVPGFAATAWGEALNAIAVTANSLISKAGLLEKKPAPKADEPAQPQA